LNDSDRTLLPIFPVPDQGLPEGLTGFRAVIPSWGIDWGRFIDIDTRNYDGTPDQVKRRLQFAYRIDTSLADPLKHLPAAVAANPSSLPLRNLERGWRLGLPSGQSVARALGVEPLADEEILIGQGVDSPEQPLPNILSISDATGAVFAGNCPLWTYILAEAIAYKIPVKLPVSEDVTIGTPVLGPVGGRIVAEVLLGLLFGDANSNLSLDPQWTPNESGEYALKDFVAYALGT
jgi:hypothetical protein